MHQVRIMFGDPKLHYSKLALIELTQARAPWRRARPRFVRRLAGFSVNSCFFGGLNGLLNVDPRATRGLWNLSLRRGTLELSGYRCADELTHRPGVIEVPQHPAVGNDRGETRRPPPGKASYPRAAYPRGRRGRTS